MKEDAKSSENGEGCIYRIVYDAYYADKAAYVEDVTFYALNVSAVLAHLFELELNPGIAYKELWVSHRLYSAGPRLDELLSKNFSNGIELVPSSEWVEPRALIKPTVKPGLHEALVRFLHEDFDSPDSLTLNTVKRLVKTYYENWNNPRVIQEANFCHSNDFPIDLLTSYFPREWSIQRSGGLEAGQYRLAIVEYSNGALKEINTLARSVEVEAFDVCGIVHAIFCNSKSEFESAYGGYGNFSPYDISVFLVFYYRPSGSPSFLKENATIVDDVHAVKNGDNKVLNSKVLKSLSRWIELINSSKKLEEFVTEDATWSGIANAYVANSSILSGIERTAASALRESIQCVKMPEN
jgi:hypothetical protein